MIQTNSCDKYMCLAKTEVRDTLCQSDRAMQESKTKPQRSGLPHFALQCLSPSKIVNNFRRICG